MKKKNPVLLLILDGWGYSEEKAHNAITAAHTPHYDDLIAQYPHSLISGCGEDVGLPPGQMGNSEVGHLTLGSGRVIFQDLGRINLAIEQGTFFENAALLNACQVARDAGKTLHVMGLLSDGGVHSHIKHLLACLTLATQQDVPRIAVHVFLDGRDTPPQSAEKYLKQLENWCAQHVTCQVASISGRYYAMDRDQNWDRVQKSYDAIVAGQSNFVAANSLEALQAAYTRGETDEFVQPTCIATHDVAPITLEDGDSVIYMNFRSDRARALTYALTQADFQGFDRTNAKQLGVFVGLTSADQQLTHPVAFPPQTHAQVLADYLAQQGLTQLHIAETEKYAHVTFFFNGGKEVPFPGEERILIPSPAVSTYDLQPEMSAPAVTDQLVKAISSQAFDFIVCNFANADMVGHTGNFDAAVKAVEAIDQCLGRILTALSSVSGQALITADHGNVECMQDPHTQQAHTAHTTSLVPIIYFGENALNFRSSKGTLSDVAPTVLTLMKIKQPVEMTGQTLLHKES